MKAGGNRLFDLRQHGREPRAGAEHGDVALASRRAARRVEPAGAFGHGHVREGPVEEPRQRLAGLVGRRIRGAEQRDLLAAGKRLSHLDTDGAETDESDARVMVSHREGILRDSARLVATPTGTPRRSHIATPIITARDATAMR